MHRIACKFVVIPSVEVIKWIITHMDDSHLVLHSESGDQLTTYYKECMQTYYKILRPTKYANNYFYIKWVDLDTNNIIKSWCREP